jgi:hypothetical protein
MKGYVFIAGKDIGAYPATVAGVARSASRLQQDDTQDRYEGPRHFSAAMLPRTRI